MINMNTGKINLLFRLMLLLLFLEGCSKQDQIEIIDHPPDCERIRQSAKGNKNLLSYIVPLLHIIEAADFVFGGCFLAS